MNWDAIAEQYLGTYSEPREAWKESLYDRNLADREGSVWDRVLEGRLIDRGTDKQQLANAEHYLWANQFGQQSPLHGAIGMYMPLGYSLSKNVGLLGGRSEADAEQLSAGTQGAFRGLLGSGMHRMIPGVGAAIDAFR